MFYYCTYLLYPLVTGVGIGDTVWDSTTTYFGGFHTPEIPRTIPHSEVNYFLGPR